MAHYLLQVAYTPEAWATMVKNPQDRLAAITPVVERLGGKVTAGFLAFGEYDAVVLLEFPGNVDAAAFAMAAAAGGSAKAVKTTPLMTVQEGMDAMRRAQGSGFRPPA
jgi:uncharacterized protein with GYD domain